MSAASERLSAALADRYRFERELGEGGMATVYLARDLKHDRDVAIKVLKPELAAVLGAERFVQEIKTTAQLQHPNILPLFDSGEAEGFLYYVMPYVEGESLRDRLDRETQLGVDEAVRITGEVADALDYAHRHGVVHRDIKPENILLHDGRPMVADFGIALAVSAAAGGRMTETGLSLGTPHYMSPEQATAEKNITARSDIYSLGAVLYEMLTGQPPHLGGSAQQIIMKIVTEEAAPVTRMRKSVPPNVVAATARALEKLPADRFDSARAFADALANPAFTVASAASTPVALRRSRRLTSILAAACVALAAAALWGWLRPSAATVPPMVQLSVQGDSSFSIINHCCGPSIATSADGSRLVFLIRMGDSVLYGRRDLADTAVHPIPGTVDGSTPFLSPDGRWLGFVKDTELMKVDLSGGPPIKIATTGATVHGATWADDGTIYFSAQGGIYRVSAGGGSPELVSAPDTSVEFSRILPVALPGSRALLYVSWPKNHGNAAARIAALDLRTGKSHVLVAGVEPGYAAGHLVYVLPDGTLMARSFDLGSLSVQGDPVPLATHLLVHENADAEYAVSRSGTLVIRAGGGRMVLRLYSMQGALLRSFPSPLSRWSPRFSPNGGRVAYAQEGQGEVGDEIWQMDLATGLPTRLSAAESHVFTPIWSADGRSVRWVQLGDSGLRLMARPADQSRPAAPFGKDTVPLVFGLPSRHGGPIPMERITAGGAVTDLWMMDADGTHQRPFLATSSSEGQGTVSPSGHWIAYMSDETGRPEIYVQPFPAGGARSRLSDDGGQHPEWVSDTSLVYLHADALEYVRVAFDRDGVRAVGGRTVVTRIATQADYQYPFDVSPDGKTVLVVQGSGTTRLLVETNRLRHLAAEATPHE